MRVLGNLLGLDGFEYDDAFQIRDELASQGARPGSLRSGGPDFPARG